MTIQLTALQVSPGQNQQPIVSAPQPSRVYVLNLNDIAPQAELFDHNQHVYKLSEQDNKKISQEIAELSAVDTFQVQKIHARQIPKSLPESKTEQTTELPKPVVQKKTIEQKTEPLKTNVMKGKKIPHTTSVISPTKKSQSSDAPIISLTDIETTPVNKPTLVATKTQTINTDSTFSAPDFYIPTLILLSVTLCCGIMFLFYRKNHLLRSKLENTEKNLAYNREELQELQQRIEQIKLFQNNLTDAGLTTKLQQPRLVPRNEDHSNKPPEKYQYVKKLAKTGMKPEDIARTLSISPHEASQLVTLSRLAA